jgi:excinuclease UvrABC nuclease subunit
VTETTLYRHFAADGTLLYVGIAKDHARRQYSHSRESAWWPRISRVETTIYPDRKTAFDAETVAIRTEHPEFNLKKRIVDRPKVKTTLIRIPSDLHRQCKARAALEHMTLVSWLAQAFEHALDAIEAADATEPRTAP